ncbi:MAG: class D sortase [Acidobacteriaceae bacterium]
MSSHAKKHESGPSAPPRARRSQSWLRKGPEVALLTVAILLLAFYAAGRLESFFSSRALLRTFQSTPSAPADRSQTPVARAPLSPSSSAIPPSERPAVDEDATPEGPLAVLIIPKIRLEVPVLDGTDALTLNRAVGKIAGTALPGQSGNIGLAGHRDGFFRNLGRLQSGDLIELETKSRKDKYVVEEIHIVNPEDVWVLSPRSVPSLTLITCYPFHGLGHAPQRYVVTASLAPRDENPAVPGLASPAR